MTDEESEPERWPRTPGFSVGPGDVDPVKSQISLWDIGCFTLLMAIAFWIISLGIKAINS